MPSIVHAVLSRCTRYTPNVTDLVVEDKVEAHGVVLRRVRLQLLVHVFPPQLHGEQLVDKDGHLVWAKEACGMGWVSV